MKRFSTLIFSLLFIILSAAAQFGQSPFELSLTISSDESEAYVDLTVKLDIPAEHIIYAESFSVVAEGAAIKALKRPEIQEKPDLIDTSTMVKVYDHTFEAVYRLTPARDGALVTVNFQGCDKSVCFMPESRAFQFDQAALTIKPYSARNDGDGFEEVAAEGVNPWLLGGKLETAGGYMTAADFVAFLDKVEGKGGGAEGRGLKRFFDDPVVFLQKNGMILTLILVLIGGVLLNLTPCVLPMIPINLAIIGAGAGTRGRGFTLGSAYGFGIVMVYGGLGWVILRSGLFFGAIQANPWFNLVIAVIFTALSLALFDLFMIDFTKFITPKAGQDQKKGVVAAFVAGAVSALLAGACVAPVVLAVLLLAGNLYGGGMTSAQFLPFVLGAGMALPWPFAGAGLSILPSPGMWMVRVKQLFGVFLLLLAAYYFYVAGSGFWGGEVAREGSILAGDQKTWVAKVEEARAAGKPIFVDFWATWCKNCAVMEKKTFQNETVEKRLENYVVVKVQAEKPGQSPAREMLSAFGVRGLPGFAVLMFDQGT